MDVTVFKNRGQGNVVNGWVLLFKDVWTPAALTGVLQLKPDDKPQVNGRSAGNRAHVSTEKTPTGKYTFKAFSVIEALKTCSGPENNTHLHLICMALSMSTKQHQKMRMY